MGKRSASEDVDTLRKNVEWALRNAEAADALMPMLAKLARSAEPCSDAWVLAHRHLAELAVDRHPWRAAIFARRVVQVDAEDDGAWAILGLAQTLLGHYRAAVANYRRATALSPRNPWYLHNLGHLLDVALDRPDHAVTLLGTAHEIEPREHEISASYAHALARIGELAHAKRVLRKVVARGPTAEHLELWRWLEQGAPAKPTEARARARRRTRPSPRRAEKG